MHTQLNKFYFVLLILIQINLSAKEIIQFNYPVVGYTNYAKINSLLFISDNGTATWFENLKNISEKNYKISSSECLAKSQNTSQMDTEISGLTLAFPFMVGLDRACVIDETTQTIKLISNYRQALPKNAFSIAYLNEDSNFSYFLINGREFPNADYGYISILSINKKTFATSIDAFISDIPGFSAAMLVDSKEFFITTWEGQNEIYKMSVDSLTKLAQNKKIAKFNQLANKVTVSFTGMSTFVIKNNTHFLFYNKDYENYLINSITGLRENFRSACTPIAGYQNNWIVLCNDNRVELTDLK